MLKKITIDEAIIIGGELEAGMYRLWPMAMKNDVARKAFNKMLMRYDGLITQMYAMSVDWAYERMLAINDQIAELDTKLPNVTDLEFSNFCYLVNLSGPLNRE